jgi:hypothetical protein
MGAEFKDYDNDGLPDILFTALAGETFPLLLNAGEGNFVNASPKSRMGALTLRHSGWGLGLFDFNNDGWKDLFTANSHVNDRVEQFESASYKEADSVFANSGGVFQDVSADAGLTLVKAHRGAAFADFDGDGRVDAVVSSLGEPAELWENISPDLRQWLSLRLRGVRSNRDGIGARIRIGNQRGNDDGRGLCFIERVGCPFRTGRGGAGSEDRDPLAERHSADASRCPRGSGLDRDGSGARVEVRGPGDSPALARELNAPVAQCNGSRCDKWRCRSDVRNGRQAGTDGNSSARTGGSRL